MEEKPSFLQFDAQKLKKNQFQVPTWYLAKPYIKTSESRFHIHPYTYTSHQKTSNDDKFYCRAHSQGRTLANWTSTTRVCSSRLQHLEQIVGVWKTSLSNTVRHDSHLLARCQLAHADSQFRIAEQLARKTPWPSA
jgi:hypothetical protein